MTKEDQKTPACLISYVPSLFAGILFFAAAYWILANGHPHEDAYILYQYVRNLGNGAGIVFDPSSGPAEGATDFLWMLSLAGLYKLGLAPAVGAGLLNALGLIIIIHTLFRLNANRFDLPFGVTLAILTLSGGVAASLCGFSTLAYGGLIALFLRSIHDDKPATAAFLGLTIGLTRPDGVLFALGGLFAFLMSTPAEARRKFLWPLAVAAAIGAGYFIWRAEYFGFLLPLPLMVKSQLSIWYEGLIENLRAINYYLFLLFPLFIPGTGKALQPAQRRTIYSALAAALTLAIALLFAHQSQNIAARFQFPVILALLVTYLITMRYAPSDRVTRTVMLLLLPAVVMVQNAPHLTRCLRTMTGSHYINNFPQLLRTEGIQLNTIALTEAGRFPYWYQAPVMIDLIGLNSPEIATRNALSVLNETNPDLVFIHHAGRYDTRSYPKNVSYYVTDTSQIKLSPHLHVGKNPVYSVPEKVLTYARSQSRTAIFVRYFDDLNHVYFLPPEMNTEAFLRALKLSFTARFSYLKSEAIRPQRDILPSRATNQE